MNAHNFTNAAYLARIKAAVLLAVRKSSRRESFHGVGHATVYNRRERPSLDVIAHRGGRFEVRDQHDNDVTHLVKTALREFHATLRAAQ